MEVDMIVLWNIVVTLVIVPLGYTLKALSTEQKRLDILVNKTREEIAKNYVTKEELSDDVDRIFETLCKLEQKLDRYFEQKLNA